LLTKLRNFLKVGLLGLGYVGNARSGDSSRCTTGLQIWNTFRFAIIKIVLVRVRRGQREQVIFRQFVWSSATFAEARTFLLEAKMWKTWSTLLVS